MTHPAEDKSLEIWARAGHGLPPEKVAELEARVAADPNDVEARSTLMGSYQSDWLRARQGDPPRTDAGAALLRHGTWFVAHRPELKVTMLLLGTREDSAQESARLAQLWNEAVERSPNDARVLQNAAHFFGFFGPRRDVERQRELLVRACALAPRDPEPIRALAQVMDHEARRGRKPAAENAAERAKVAGLFEQVAGLRQDPEHRAGALNDLAKAALDAGQLDKAERCAREALAALDGTARDWNWGNVWHKCHGVLGITALRAGDVEAARRHLLDSGRTPGSPQLSSFGPNMRLAQALLERGERAVVLEYLTLLEEFWKGPNSLQKLLGWRGMIERGLMPDFGANMHY